MPSGKAGAFTPAGPTLSKVAARILLIVLLMLAGYCLFSKYGVVLNLVYTMFALALTGFAADIVELAGWVRGKHRTRKRSGRTKKNATDETDNP